MIECLLPNFARSCRENSDVVVIHQDLRRRLAANSFRIYGSTGRDLIPAINTVLKNQTFYPAIVTTSVHAGPKGDGRKLQEGLTPRQKEIVKLLAQGVHTEKIAEALGISEKTVETHRQNILRRTNSHSTAELVRYAIRNGIIEA